MANTVNAAGRLDRLPISRFHWKILGLIAGGAFLDAFDIYLANGSVGNGGIEAGGLSSVGGASASPST